MIRETRSSILITALGATMLLVGGCIHPLSRDLDQMLREQIQTNNRAYLDAVSQSQLIEVDRPPSMVEEHLKDRIDHLEETSGMRANEKETLDPGPDLSGSEQLQGVSMSLARVVKLVVDNNLDLKIARLNPAIAETQITQQQAVFDAVYFNNLNFQKLDTPQPRTVTGLETFGSVQSDTRSLETGIRKVLTTGGQISASTTFVRNFRDPSFFDPVERYYDADVLFSLQQPLLRTFGSDVVKSQIHLAQNAKQQMVFDLKQTLLDATFSGEQAYWHLVAARHDVLIAQRLFRASEGAMKKMEARQVFDATSVQIGQMQSFVARIQLALFDNQQALRQASDNLKQLMSAPDLSLVDEELVIPLDSLETMATARVQFNLREAFLTALRKRPDIQISLSQINDATIRQRVADNQRLPVLNVTGSVRVQGLDVDNIGGAYENMGDADFIDYVVGLLFEVPIGNRGPEAAFRQAQITRRASVIAYQRTVRDSVFEIKAALRELQRAWRSIGVARIARLAAANTVRAMREQVRIGIQLTPEFIDTKINREEELANNESREVRAISDYSIAIAAYYRAIGTLLELNGIDFDADSIRD